MKKNLLYIIIPLLSLLFLITLIFVGCSEKNHLSPTSPDGVPNESIDPEEIGFDTPGPQDWSSIQEAQQTLSLKCAWSPNCFPTGQCTWYVDGRVYEYSGWLLKFSVSYGRHAYRWWDLVTNAGKRSDGQKGDIMVLDKCASLPYGHVMFVESVGNNRWTVTHANWSAGQIVRYIEGRPIRQVTFEKVSGGVRIVGRSKVYPLRGFLYNITLPSSSPIARFEMSAQGQTKYENEILNLTVLPGQKAKVNFSAQRSYDPDGQITSYIWKINGSTVSTSSDFPFDLGNGRYDIFLTVQDNNGQTNSVGGTVIVTEAQAPTPTPTRTPTPTLTPTIRYQGHFAYTGWIGWVGDDVILGSPGGNQLEALRITISQYNIKYQAHVAYDGWQGWKYDGGMAGTTGQAKGMEAIRIQLVNAPTNLHVAYRVYVRNQGWQSWMRDGAMAGTTGQARPIEAIQIRIEN